MIDTEPNSEWKPIDDALLEECAKKRKIKKLTVKEITKDVYVIDILLTWRSETNRLCLKRYRARQRTFKSLDRLKTYLKERKVDQTIFLELLKEE